MSNEEQRTSQDQQATADATDEQGRDRPDRRPPRGNQEVEQIDVERGEGKLERVLGW